MCQADYAEVTCLLWGCDGAGLRYGSALHSIPQADTNEYRRLDDRRTALDWRPGMPVGLTEALIQASGNLVLCCTDDPKLT